jgi:hypothetical protein
LFDIFVLFGLVFADNLVIITKNERETKEMMKNLGKYVRKKKPEVNVEKTKMMVFNKRKRKSVENKWNCEGRKIETSANTWVTQSMKEHGEIVRKANKVVRFGK